MEKNLMPNDNGQYQGPLWFSIGHIPVLYIIIAVFVIIILGFLPASIVIGAGGGGWPLHDVIHPLIGLILGPVAGPIASLLGFALSNTITSYTSLGGHSYLIGGMSAFTVGMLIWGGKRGWLLPWIIIAGAHVLFFFETRGHEISPFLWFSNVLTVTIALVLIVIPAVRHWALHAIADDNNRWKMGGGFYILFFLGSTGGIQLYWAIAWPIDPWSAEYWPGLVLIIFLERTIFTLIGAIIAVFLVPLLKQTTLPGLNLGDR